MYGRIPTPESEETPNRDGTQELLSPEWMYGVSASGFVELHVKPTITFGIDFNKNFIKTDGKRQPGSRRLDPFSRRC